MVTVLRWRSSRCLRWSLLSLFLFTLSYLFLTQWSLASVYGVFNILLVDLHDDTSDTSGARLRLENLSSRESELIQSKLKIFFVQTSKNGNLLARHACSIESAARLHPAGSIFVLMSNQYIDTQHGSYRHLKRYSNVHFLHFDEQEIYAGTALAQLNRTKRNELIRYFAISHTSDFIRTALLYKYGGIYFDLDVIPLRSFHSFVNTVALESSESVNVAVLAFEKRHLALELQMGIQLESMNKPLHALCWNCLGPLALTEALQHVCEQGRLHVHAPEKCQRIVIQPSFVFYPIAYQEIPSFFRQSSSTVDTHRLSSNASVHSIHYFHHMTMNLPVQSMSPFAQLAQDHCPRVYAQLVDQRLSISFLSDISVVLLCLSLTIVGIFLFLLVRRALSALRKMRMFSVNVNPKRRS